MRQNHFWCSILLLPGCVSVTQLGQATLVVRPEFDRQTLTTISPYTQANIDHLTLKLFTTAEQDLGVSKTLLNAQLGNSIAFSNLKVNTTYRVRAYAYASAGTTQCISNDANSYVDIAVGTDDRPTVGAIPVTLINKDFNGQGTGTIQVTSGGYLDAGASNMDFLAPAGMVTTFAGNGATGSIDGTGTNAGFMGPYGVAVDASDNVFVADRDSGIIRKITPAGVVTTFAGPGYALYDPSGMAFDKAGNLFVAERGDHRILKFTPDGNMTIVAGSGSSGTANGIGTSASFNGPYAVTVDSSNNLYVSDTTNHLIRKITASGVVTTLAGNGSGTFADGTGNAAAFRNPKGITVDTSGNVYVADYANDRIRKVTPDGVVSTITTATNPQGVFFDSVGNLYYTAGSIRKIKPSNEVVFVAGYGVGTTDGFGSAAKFSNPCGIAIDSHGNLYVADYNNNTIRKIQ